MTRLHRPIGSIATVALVVALGALVVAGVAPSGAQTAPSVRFHVPAIDETKYPDLVATVSVSRPDAGAALTAKNFVVADGKTTLPVTVRKIGLNRRKVILVVDPGPTAATAALVANAAISVLKALMPQVSATVVAGGATPKVVLANSHNLLLAAAAIRNIPLAPSGSVKALTLAVQQAGGDLANSSIVAIASGAGGTATEAKAVADLVALLQIPVDVLLPGVTLIPGELTAFATGGGTVAAAPSIVAAIPAVDRIIRGLENWYSVGFRVSTPASTKPDLSLTVKADGVVGLRPLALKPTAAPTPTTAAPPTTAATAPVTTGGALARSTGTSRTVKLAAVAGGGVLVLVLLGLAVALLLRRRRARPERRGEPVQGPPDPVADPLLPAPPFGPPVAAPAAPSRTSFQGAAADDRIAEPAGHDSVASMRSSPATGHARWERTEPRSVMTDPLDRSRPGARWWMYQRPDTGHQTSGQAAGSGDRGTQPSDDPEPSAALAPSRQAPPRPELDRLKADLPNERDRAVRDNSFMAPLVSGGVLLLTAAVVGHWGTAALGPFLLPVAGILLAIGFGRIALQNHPEEPWVARLLILGVLAKLVLSFAREFTLVHQFERPGDAAGYDDIGTQFVLFWRGNGPNPMLNDLRETNFMRWITGVAYYVFGVNFLTGFFVFGLLAVAGSYFWYRATVNAVPFIDRRLYLILVMFMPSIVFWPAVIGKEALMQLGIGAMALGTAYVMRARLYRGLIICGCAGWLLWVVRPHLLALVTVAGAGGYLFGKVRQKDGKSSSLLSRPVGIVVVALLVSFTITQGANFLGLQDLSVDSIQTRLNEQTATTSRGGSEFSGGGASLNPIDLPQGAVTVLLRPLPWETDSPLQLLSSFESVCLAAFMVIRFRSLRVAFSRARVQPYLMYCWILTGLYCVAFSSFANFGLLVRQRSLVLPALCVLLAVDPDLAARTDVRGIISDKDSSDDARRPSLANARVATSPPNLSR